MVMVHRDGIGKSYPSVVQYGDGGHALLILTGGGLEIRGNNVEYLYSALYERGSN